MSIDLSAPEVQEAIKKAVTEATEGLVRKRDELLTELKEARKGKAINPEDVDRLESRIDELEGKLKEAEKSAKTATKEADTAKKALADAEGSMTRMLVDNGLTDALAKAGVTNPVHLRAAKALLASQVQVVTEGENKLAKVGDKALGDFIGEWAKGDEGKFFVAAPASSGGGANGSRSNNHQAPSVTRQAFEAMNPVAQREHIQKQGVVTDA